jgi:2-oxoacid dehydrogenases acyltransferase (catalytic domain)
MKQKHADYKMVSYPKIRRFMAAGRRSVQYTPRMHGLIEVDVTRARAFLRDYLSMTISFDHDIIDGAPAARFTQRLKELIESGYGLPDSTVESEQTPLSREVNYVYDSRESNFS